MIYFYVTLLLIFLVMTARLPILKQTDVFIIMSEKLPKYHQFNFGCHDCVSSQSSTGLIQLLIVTYCDIRMTDIQTQTNQSQTSVSDVQIIKMQPSVQAGLCASESTIFKKYFKHKK